MNETDKKDENNMPLSLFWNPFERYAGSSALVIGTIFLLVGSVAAAIGNARFIGLISMQFVDSVHWLDGFFDQVVSLCIAVLVFTLAAIISGSRRFRIIDILGTFMMAKAPLLVLPLLNFNGWMYRKSIELTEVALEGQELPNVGDTVILLLVSMVLILFFIWTIVLLFHAYRTSTNLKGLPSFISFVLAMIVTMILSYLIIPSTYVA
ncbi:MAG: hypothetical protein EA411_03725 [Saprospirales bacterium]|nr:MAG: hypothetical protein EA411_03725 [Saprospirales bacterium]